MMIEKNGIVLECRNNSEFFEEQSSLYISADKLRSVENIGYSFCPNYSIIRAINCEMITKISQWKEQILMAYLNFGSADTPEVDLYGIKSRFIKLYLESDSDDKWYIARYEIFDGEGNYIEEKEF